jgi:hypothetical protein
MAISLGTFEQNAPCGRVFERLSIAPEGNGLRAVMVSRTRSVLTWMPPLQADTSLRDASLEALLWAFGWHKKPSALPDPLTEVPIRGKGSKRVVSLTDIPPYLRAGLAQHLGLSSGTIPADIWLHFVRKGNPAQI